jgi:cellulose 1,4-beta-cellobiosidase
MGIHLTDICGLQGNVEGWTPSTNDKNAGVGNHGSCCVEMDVWEANSMATAYTPHSCTNVGQHMCTTNSCGGTYSTDRYGGDCDPDGCDFNSYRMGNTSFYGPGLIVDTTKPFTVTTQFLTDASGNLNEIKRFYVQNSVLIPNSQSNVAGVSGNSVNPTFCPAEQAAFGQTDYFTARGGWTAMTNAFKQGMVLVMSLWDDVSVFFSLLLFLLPSLYLENIPSSRHSTNLDSQIALRQCSLARQHLPRRIHQPRLRPWSLRHQHRCPG